MTRSRFLRGTAGVVGTAAGLSTTGLLAACGGGEGEAGSSDGKVKATPDEVPVARPDGGKPVMGGTLRIGLVGGGEVESMNPAMVTYTNAGYQMETMAFNRLAEIDPELAWQPSLAEFEANDDQTELLVRIREGVTFHDGSPLTPDDVLFSIRTWLDPANANAAALSAIDAKRLSRDGASAVRVPLTRAYADLPAVFAAPGCSVVKDGTTDYTKPVGTGPFKVKSFKPGTNSVWERNAEYWNTAPYVDGAEVIAFADSDALVNALLAGQVDVAQSVPPGRAKSLAKETSIRVYCREFGTPHCITMRCDKAPFDDVRVRQAIKLVADRAAIANTAMAGFARIGNDMLGADFPHYATAIPQRERDIEQARSLLNQAGQSDLRVTLETSDVIDGMTAVATVFAQQAAEAGITVRIKRVPPGQYFNPGAGFLKRAFGQDLWPLVSVPSVWDLTQRSDAFSNETHWQAPGWDAKLNAAQAESDPAAADALWAELMQTQHDEGGYLIPVAGLSTSGARANVRNVPTTALGWSTGSQLNHAWIESA